MKCFATILVTLLAASDTLAFTVHHGHQNHQVKVCARLPLLQFSSQQGTTTSNNTFIDTK
jgi:hypothetical protein